MYANFMVKNTETKAPSWASFRHKFIVVALEMWPRWSTVDKVDRRPRLHIQNNDCGRAVTLRTRSSAIVNDIFHYVSH